MLEAERCIFIGFNALHQFIGSKHVVVDVTGRGFRYQPLLPAPLDSLPVALHSHASRLATNEHLAHVVDAARPSQRHHAANGGDRLDWWNVVVGHAT